jgi:hypothetical protein
MAAKSALASRAAARISGTGTSRWLYHSHEEDLGVPRMRQLDDCSDGAVGGIRAVERNKHLRLHSLHGDLLRGDISFLSSARQIDQ